MPVAEDGFAAGSGNSGINPDEMAGLDLGCYVGASATGYLPALLSSGFDVKQPAIRHARVRVTTDQAVTSRMTPMIRSKSKGQR
jgi:acyl transferase domain-containing protein